MIEIENICRYKLNLNVNLKFNLGRVENIIAKGEDAVGIVWYRVKLTLYQTIPTFNPFPNDRF